MAPGTKSLAENNKSIARGKATNELSGHDASHDEMMTNHDLEQLGPDAERRELIVIYAWQTWTRNGLGLDADRRRETEQAVQHAANNTYFEGISTPDWLAATLARLAEPNG